MLGSDREIEGEPAISVLGGHLPNVDLVPFRLEMDEIEYFLTDAEEGELADRLDMEEYGEVYHDTRAYLMLADPFTTPIVDWLVALDDLTSAGPDYRRHGQRCLRPRRVRSGIER